MIYVYNPKDVKTLFYLLNEEQKKNIFSYLEFSQTERYQTFHNINEIKESFDFYNMEFKSKTNCYERDLLRSYTFNSFRHYNAILRNNWNYEEHGKYDENQVQIYRTSVENLQHAIYKYPKCNLNFVTYRGINLTNFKEYGIESFHDLTKLKNQFLHEAGFTSTSLLQETSFFQRKLENGGNYNVLIQYCIPKDYAVGAYLYSEEFTAADGQNEYLLNSSTLGYVSNIEIMEDKKSAKLSVIIIPTQIWEPERLMNYEKNIANKKA